jgi:pimeloyl-ACP methyl ester carboxylesterase
VAATPGRFERLAFVLPAALDRGRSDGATERLHRLAAAMRANDVDRLTTLLLAEVPPPLRQHRAARVLTARRARELAGTEPPEPRTDVRPLESLADLTAVVAPSLVLAQHDDDLHTVEIAETLAEALPNAELVVLPAGGIFWTARFEARDVLARHLAERP